MCHVSRVTCHLSPVTCHMSHVFFLFFIYIFFSSSFFTLKQIGQSGGASCRRVCYQRGLPRLVIYTYEHYRVPLQLFATQSALPAPPPHFTQRPNIAFSRVSAADVTDAFAPSSRHFWPDLNNEGDFHCHFTLCSHGCHCQAANWDRLIQKWELEMVNRAAVVHVLVTI